MCFHSFTTTQPFPSPYHPSSSIGCAVDLNLCALRLFPGCRLRSGRRLASTLSPPWVVPSDSDAILFSVTLTRYKRERLHLNSTPELGFISQPLRVDPSMRSSSVTEQKAKNTTKRSAASPTSSRPSVWMLSSTSTSSRTNPKAPTRAGLIGVAKRFKRHSGSSSSQRRAGLTPSKATSHRPM